MSVRVDIDIHWCLRPHPCRQVDSTWNKWLPWWAALIADNQVFSFWSALSEILSLRRDWQKTLIILRVLLNAASCLRLLIAISLIVLVPERYVLKMVVSLTVVAWIALLVDSDMEVSISLLGLFDYPVEFRTNTSIICVNGRCLFTNLSNWLPLPFL